MDYKISLFSLTSYNLHIYKYNYENYVLKILTIKVLFLFYILNL